MTIHCIVAVAFYNPSFIQRVTFMKSLLASGFKKHPFSNVFSFEAENNADCVELLRLATSRAAKAASIGYLTFVVQIGNSPASFHDYPLCTKI